MQSAKGLGNVPKALVVTNGFDPLRDVGIEYAGKLKEAGVDVNWIHFDDMAHGFLQMTPWSHGAGEAARTMAKAVGDVIYGKDVGNK
jgi:acetyl esterase/lipase